MWRRDRALTKLIFIVMFAFTGVLPVLFLHDELKNNSGAERREYNEE